MGGGQGGGEGWEMGFSDGISGFLALVRSAVDEMSKLGLGWVELDRFSLFRHLFLQLLHVPFELRSSVLEPRYHLLEKISIGERRYSVLFCQKIILIR